QRIEIRSRVEAFPMKVAACDLLIGMCGYNTACEALSYRVPFLAVPREAPSTEQVMRARALSRLGLLTFIRQDRLESSSLVRAACATLAKGPRADVPLPLDGVARARDLLLEML